MDIPTNEVGLVFIRCALLSMTICRACLLRLPLETSDLLYLVDNLRYVRIVAYSL